MVIKKSKIKISIIIIFSIALSIIYTNYLFDVEDSIYEIYMGERIIGYMEDEAEAKLLCKGVVEGIKDRVENQNLDIDKITIKGISNDVSTSNKSEIEDKIISCISVESNLTNMIIGGKDYGLIAKVEEGKEVLKKVGDIYIDSINLDRDNILSLDIKSNIVYEKVKTKISDISSIDDIAENIFKDNESKNLVDVSIKYRDKKIVDVDPVVKIVSKDDMYIGEMIKEEGVSGSREVVADITYKNGKKVDEKIREEKSLVEAKDTIIYKGSKSPIDYQVEFLGHPTKGGYITSNFGARWGRHHNGIDISHNIGDPVYAAFDGIVKEASYKYSYGNKILLEHEGSIDTIYAHLDSFNVKVGDSVKKGDFIGRVGNTGNSTGSHLHFELRVNNKPVDPKKYIEELG